MQMATLLEIGTLELMLGGHHSPVFLLHLLGLLVLSQVLLQSLPFRDGRLVGQVVHGEAAFGEHAHDLLALHQFVDYLGLLFERALCFRVVRNGIGVAVA